MIIKTKQYYHSMVSDHFEEYPSSHTFSMTMFEREDSIKDFMTYIDNHGYDVVREKDKHLLHMRRKPNAETRSQSATL